MPINFVDSFQVSRGAQEVWQCLSDPLWVAGCVPGLKDLRPTGDGLYEGLVEVKVGPVTLKYELSVGLIQRDDEVLRAVLSGSGRQVGAFGHAQGTLSYVVTPHSSGQAEVSVQAQVEVSGKVVQLGASMLGTVAKQLFKQFASCVQERLKGNAVWKAGNAEGPCH